MRSEMEPKKMIDALLAAGLSQTDVAYAVGISQSQVSKIHTGDRTRLSWEKYEQLRSLHAQLPPRRSLKNAQVRLDRQPRLVIVSNDRVAA